MRLQECNMQNPTWEYRYALTYPSSWDDCLSLVRATRRDLDNAETLISAAEGEPFVAAEIGDESDAQEIPEARAIRLRGNSRTYGGEFFEFTAYSRTDVFVMSVSGEYVKRLAGDADGRNLPFIFDRFADSIEIASAERRTRTYITDWIMEALQKAILDKDNFRQRRTFRTTASPKSADLTEICNAVVRNRIEVDLEAAGEKARKQETEPAAEKEEDWKNNPEIERRMEEFRKKLPKSPVFRIRFSDETADFRSSKLGGEFYWPDDDPPELNFLCQINFAELPENGIFPKTGLLQFFIKDDDASAYGLFDDEGYRVVRHEEIESGGRRFRSDGTYTPVVREQRMTFVPDEESLTYSDFRFEAYKELADGVPEDAMYEDERFRGEGSKMLGYPYFTQWDPRDEEDGRRILLLQLDSCDRCVEWGDAGVANFFISPEALERRDFSDVLYNWDCS